MDPSRKISHPMLEYPYIEHTSNLKDQDVINFCNSSKAIKERMCTEAFWRARFLEHFGNIDKPIFRTWENTYKTFVLSYELPVIGINVRSLSSNPFLVEIKNISTNKLLF